MSRDNVELVRRSVYELNRAIADGDFDRMIRLTREFADAEIEYKPVEEGTVLRGHADLVDYWRRWLDPWKEIRWEIEEISDIGDDKVFASYRIAARAKESGVEIDQRFFYLYDVREGKVAGMREFLDRSRALQAAGLTD